MKAKPPSQPQPLHNAIIRASAGSGKTFQLVRRYLRLLALGESPDGIVAMTFTRKAAREFFERILQKLAELARDPSRAVGYLDELAVPGVALGLLRKVIRSMDRLRLGTIDSFFASITRCFPFELGLAGQATIMPEDETKRARTEVMNALLVDITREGDGAALREMLEAWKRATTGRELHSPSTHLDSWFDKLHPLFLESSAELHWGSREAVWPDRTMPVWKSDVRLESAIQALRDVLNFEIFTKKGPAKWDQFFTEALARRPGEPFKKGNSIEYMLGEERLPHGDYPLLREGRAAWSMFGKSPILDIRAGSALADVLDIVVGRELMCRVERTQGRRSVVARFDAQYERRVRGRGRLAFADLTWLLSGRLHALGEKGDEESRERWEAMQRDWEYRLDGRFQHWLFDEFQDTSRRQWEVVANLVDEAASDPEGRRSFFAVGDLKQSLYLFRQAEPELFLHVESRYEKVRMEKLEPLTVSHRSCPQVLDMVNSVFSQAELLRSTVPDAMQWWRFEEHSASDATSGLSGHAALLTLPDGDHEDTDAAQDEMVAALIRHIAPLERGLTCAVLVRTNDEAARLAIELRRLLHVEVVCESQVAVATDNPVTLALLSVFKLAVHPADESAENHLRMSPLAAWFATAGEHAVALLGADVRRGIAREGFLATARTWAARLREGVGEWDAFSQFRLAQFFDMAADFDASESRDVDAFLTFASTHAVRVSEHGRALQVMTVHKSKGLEFDVVILPEIQRTALDQPFKPRNAESLLIQRDPRGVLEWLLDKPPAMLIDRDARLREAERQEKARLAYQSLCRLYVGMTRAIRGLYIIMPAKGNQRSEADLLKSILAAAQPATWELSDAHVPADCWWETGSRDWFDKITISDESAPAPAALPAQREKLGPLLRKSGGQRQRRSPSGEESFRIRGGELLSDRRNTSRQLGTLVHELFAAVPWLDGIAASALETEVRRAWTAQNLRTSPSFETAAAAVLRSLANPDIRAWFEQRPAASREAWCERSFDMILQQDWISGTFDRVVIDRDVKGRPTAATILDFKTDDVSDDASIATRASGYAPQLQLYVKAVARLTGLPQEKIRTALIFTSLARLHWLG